jgi:hypothetical protein
MSHCREGEQWAIESGFLAVQAAECVVMLLKALA